jgi:uncharacterized protein
MIRRSLLTLALALLAAGAVAQADPVGAWRGLLGPGLIDLEIRVDIAGAPGALSGTIDIPAQGLFGFPLGDVALEGSTLSFAMSGIPGDPVFVGEIAGDAFAGTFTQGGQPLPFALERDLVSASSRPQEPLPPFPYLEEGVTFASGDVVLAGTLTLPAGDGRAPALLLITGSGPQDRNEEILGHKPFLVIADHLTRAGYAVLRVDDRGVGGSSGDDALASYDDLLGDVLAGVETLAAHPRVDPERIGLLGHSQGGFLAPAAATASDRVAFVILVAGPGVDGFQTLVAQNERIIELAIRAQDPNASDEVVAQVIASQIAFLEELRPLLAADDDDGARALVQARIESELAATPAEQRPDEAAIAELVAAQQAATTSPSFRAFLAFDPQPYLRRLTVPVLALFGELDVQVIPEQSVGPMRDALAAAGNADATIVVLPGLNHLMQPATTGSVDEYGAIETTFDESALTTITSWLLERFPPR